METKSKIKVSEVNSVDFEKFLSIDDIEVKNYLFATKFVQAVKIEQKVFENDEKIAFYRFSKSIKRSPKKSFYVKHSLDEWIVYNKVSGKLKVSPNNKLIKDFFILYYFNDTDILDRLLPMYRVSNSFIKRVIEDKINTVDDIISYIRSYIIRNKDITNNMIYELFCRGVDKYFIFHAIEDPQNIKFDSEFFSNLDIVVEFYDKSGIKTKTSDIKDINKTIKDYEKRQGEKFIEL